MDPFIKEMKALLETYQPKAKENWTLVIKWENRDYPSYSVFARHSIGYKSRRIFSAVNPETAEGALKQLIGSL